MIDDIIEISQYPKYPTGCESVSLYILLQHYGVNISVDSIIQALPKGPVPYNIDGTDYGANPETEFVGSPLNESSYGVYEKPIADTAETFKEGAVAQKGVSVDDIKEIIAGGNPVIAWCALTDDRVIEFRTHWTDYTTGEDVVWGSGEHAVVVYGYRESVLLISDPNTGTKREADEEKFAAGFDALGGRIVYYED